MSWYLGVTGLTTETQYDRVSEAAVASSEDFSGEAGVQLDAARAALGLLLEALQTPECVYAASLAGHVNGPSEFISVRVQRYTEHPPDAVYI